jgi:hypothetical protein
MEVRQERKHDTNKKTPATTSRGFNKGVENTSSSVSNSQPVFGWEFFFPGRIAGQVPLCHASPVFPEVVKIGFLRKI